MPTQIEILELTERFRRFRSILKEKKALFLAFVSPERCKDEKMNMLFDKISFGETTEEEEHRFFEHMYRHCEPCKIAFLRLVWLTTDVDCH